MKTLWERLDPWFIPVAAVTRFFAPADITAINCVVVRFVVVPFRRDTKKEKVGRGNGAIY